MTSADATGPRGQAGDGGDPALRRIVTPEGVALPVRLADRGERAAALIVDLLIIAAAIVAMVLLLVLAAAGGSFEAAPWYASAGLLLFFALRSFYFLFFELHWQGLTPGKRIFGLRVIDRRGGRLRADAVFARNLMREVEIFLPASILLARDALGMGGWAVLLTLVWMSIFALLPLFNRDRLRAGDIVGGTWVVAAPKAALLPDVVVQAPARQLPAAQQAAAERQGAAIAFSKQQLEVYGIYELQTLETVLRDKGPNARATRAAVCQRIQNKVGWRSRTPVDPEAFLKVFYAALRAHLEAKMLLGVRREDKHDRPG